MINILDCPKPYDTLAPVFNIIGDIIDLIRIGVPIILIVMGMIDLTKAVIAKDESEMKKAQSILVKRAISAVAVFFIITIVMLVMGMIADYIPNSDAKVWIECFVS